MDKPTTELPPTPVALPPASDVSFWNNLNSDPVKVACVLHIMSLLESSEPGLMSDAQVRAAFGEMKGYSNIYSCAPQGESQPVEEDDLDDEHPAHSEE